ncbi:MAG: forkhead-associated protein [Burkholderiales bacterium]|nr:forkhead-associated protein [Burkholderiales bacterium]
MKAAPDFVTHAWCLRFLSGAMKGRTIELRPGANAVGSAGDCDVMLPGGDVLARHLVFNVGELVVSVHKSADAEVLLNREPMQQPRRSLVPGDVVTVGRIDLQLERSYPAPERADPMFASPESVLADDAPAARPAAGRGMAFRAGAALLLLACAGLLGAGLWAGGEDRPAAATSLADVARALAPFPELEAVAAPGGQVRVKGFIESRQRRQQLDQALAPLGRRVAVEAVAVDDLVEQARRYLGNPALGVNYAGKGQLVVSGASDDDALRQRVARLAEDLHPEVLVSDRVSWRPAPPPDRDAALRARWEAWQGALPARLVGITEDEAGLRSIQLADGTRYYEGAPLKSGAQIAHIGADGLVLEGGPRADTK